MSSVCSILAASSRQSGEALKQAVKLAPEDFQPRQTMELHNNQKKFSDAEELRVAISKNSSAPTAHMYLGITLAMAKAHEGQQELTLPWP
jgi:hypothetical protein